MATMITSDCINCGACEPECPNTAIYQGGVEWEMNGVKHPPLSNEVFYIVPQKCTECVGFHDQEACAAVCPVDVCIPNPDIPETDAVLIARARELHPGVEFGPDYPSRFRTDGGPAAGALAAAPAPAAAAAPPPAAARPAGAPGASSIGLQLPEREDREVPINLLRAGNVLRCPFCTATYIVTTSMRNNVAHALEEFYGRWTADFEALRARRQRELDEFEDRKRAELEAFTASLTGIAKSVMPPGAPRKRAWIFG
jgi:ferredoxin